MDKDSFLYIFRFCCDLGFNDAEETKALLRYVDEARIDDVAVFTNVEELNTGHMGFDEQDRYIALMRRLTALLQEKGVTLSVNQWHSVMHADLGKRLRPEQPFRRMVDGNGRQADLCVCPLCTAWQRYIGTLYARYAALEPHILWLEDDFRLHNHDPLAWGGCFCEEHMRLYSEAAGKPLTREEFVRGILKPGAPHPYRKIWLDVSRDTMLSAARAVADAVRQVSQTVQIGLMSSVPQIHAAEGRDWHRLLTTLAAGQPPVNRIHLPGYQEMSPGKYMQGMNLVSMLTRAMLPEGTQVYPELENYPFSLFSKSLKFTRFQLLSGLALNIDGMTLDLYDLNGNGIVWEDDYQTMLRQTKDFLNCMTASGGFRWTREGVRVLYSPLSSYMLHTQKGEAMEELYPHDAFFGGLLPALGIPYVYTDSAGLRGKVVAISGQVLRNFSAEEIRALFEHNFIILNGDAADTLFDLGLGALAGIKAVRWMTQNGGEYAYEQTVDGQEYRGRVNARASAVISCSDALSVEYESGASLHEYTALYDSYRQRRAKGQVVVNGRVLVYPFGQFDSPTDIPPMLYNGMRQEVFEKAIDAAQASFPLVLKAAYLEPYCFERQGKLLMYLVNAGLDTQSHVRLSRCFSPALHSISVWRSDEPAPRRVSCREENGELVVDLALPGMETVLMALCDDEDFFGFNNQGARP